MIEHQRNTSAGGMLAVVLKFNLKSFLALIMLI